MLLLERFQLVIYFLHKNWNFYLHKKGLLIISLFFFSFASLKLNKLVKDAGKNKKKIELSVYSTDYPHKKIGKLTVLVEGINFMQDCLHDSHVLV